MCMQAGYKRRSFIRRRIAFTDLGKADSGFVTILDKDNKVVSNLGGTEPIYKDGELQPMAQAEKIFLNPHDVCVDDDENLYVAQWASGARFIPYKFTRVLIFSYLIR